jgi:hypothetical protein
MSGEKPGGTSPPESVQPTKFIEGPVETQQDIHLHQRYFTYRTDAGLVAGKTFNVMFTVERPAKVVWPYFKDFNLWQNAYGHYYSGVLGDLEGQTFRLGSKPNEQGPHQYRVMRVIPEHTIVLFQPVPQDGSSGGISPGFHAFLLNEHNGKTLVTGLMEHASRTTDKTEEQALEPWRQMAAESHRKFRDVLIPALKKLVYDGNR